MTPGAEFTLQAIRRILCPIDFSDASAHVVDQAIAMAGWTGARITALHVYSPFVVPVPTLPAPVDRVPQTEIERVRDNVQASFQAAAAAGVAVDIVVDIGQAAAAILNRAATLPADLIVIGTHGASGFEHFVLGSVAEKVLRRAACPVLTVPPHVRATSVLPPKSVLCAVDFSDPSLGALRLAASLAEQSGAALTVVHVIEWPWPEPPAPVFSELPPEQAAALAEYRQHVVAAATKRLETLVPSPGPAADRTARRIGHGKPYVEILRVAGEERADLIVIGLHGRNVVDMALFGSTTDQVVRRATCPVLTLKR